MARNGPGRPAHQDLLTPAEWKVAEAVRRGFTNRRIGERTGVSPDAVKFDVGNVLGKLRMSSRADLRLWDGVARGTALAQRKAAMQGESEDNEGRPLALMTRVRSEVR